MRQRSTSRAASTTASACRCCRSRRDRRGRIGDLRRPRPRHAAARGDRLRRAGRRGGRAVDRRDRHSSRPAEPDRARVAAGRPRRRRRRRLRNRERARGCGFIAAFVARMVFRPTLRRDPEELDAARRGGRLRRHGVPLCSSAPSCSARPDRTERAARAVGGAQPHCRAHDPGRDRDVGVARPPAEMTRPRGPARHPTSVTGDRDRTPASTPG